MKARRIVTLAVVVGIIITVFFIHSTASSQEAVWDVEGGLKALRKETSKDLKTAQSSIQKTETAMKEEQQRQEVRDQLPFTVRFRNTVILGDSMAEAFLDYQLLPKNIVLAVRGRRTDNSEAEVQKTISLAPEKIFLSFGMNDLPYCRGNSKRFIKQYTALIQKLQKQLPESQIYVNSIITMTSSAYAQDPILKHDKEFNRAMRVMCKELKITYIDNDSLIDGQAKYYEQDGIHPKYSFNPVWLRHMADIAGR